MSGFGIGNCTKIPNTVGIQRRNLQAKMGSTHILPSHLRQQNFTLPMNDPTYLVDTIPVHQRRLVYPIDIKCTELEDQVLVRFRGGRSRCVDGIHWGVAGRSIVGTGGIRLLRGRNERHALVGTSGFLSCRGRGEQHKQTLVLVCMICDNVRLESLCIPATATRHLPGTRT